MAKIFITGSSDGLGLLAAKELIGMGHEVVLHARNKLRAEETQKNVPQAQDILIADFESIEETKQLAFQLNQLGTFDAVIHNAGIYRASGLSKDGLPKLFAVNTLAPYILTALMNKPKRLIFLSSQMHAGGNADIIKLEQIRKGANIPTYSDTKLHDLILALVIARKWQDVYCNAVDPGWVPTKMGGSSAPDDLVAGYQTQVWLAESHEQHAMVSGNYFYHKKIQNHHPDANNESVQETLIQVCATLSGVQFPKTHVT
jgi:NAD(P)-dependent dehydrogenase (short-subunit alcohol dehydrogenase family)